MSNFRSHSFLILLITVLVVHIAHGQTVSTWLTKGDKSALLEKQADKELTVRTTPITFTVDPSMTYQNIDGFGFTFTQGSAEVLSALNTTELDEIMTELFDSNDGIGISVIRISIGASDLSSSTYTYHDNEDANLNSFSLDGPDRTYLIPLLIQALTINPDLKILATPWTAPLWMKDQNKWAGGSLLYEHYSTYAQYFVKYLEAMEAEGIPIWAITPQNEPLNWSNTPSMYMDRQSQLNFINNNLGPALDQAGITVKIIGYDHNLDDLIYPVSVANNSDYVAGTAFHLYEGEVDDMTTVYQATGKSVYLTEQFTGAEGNFYWDFKWHQENVLFGSLNNWSSATLEWNLASDQNHGPHTNGGCEDCLGAITVNGNNIERNLQYYNIAQFSKFVQTGAKRIQVNGSYADIVTVGFLNPDNSRVLAMFNSGSGTVISAGEGASAINVSVPENAVSTIFWDSDVVPSSTGLAEPTVGNSIAVYPNPSSSSGKLFVEGYHNSQMDQAVIYDQTGRIVDVLKVENGVAQLSGLSIGFYTVLFRGKDVLQYGHAKLQVIE